MEEVVSVSDLSPLAAGITGATMAPFSCSTGCSGTGITIVNTNAQEKIRNKKPGCKQTLISKSANKENSRDKIIVIISFNCIALFSQRHLEKKKEKNMVGIDAVTGVSGWVSEFQRAL